jgi:hypothetical protein
MMSDVFQKSLKAWGIRHHLSSAYNPHSKRAELAVKVGKKLLRDNTGNGGSLDTDKIMRAVLQYRNTPMQDSGGHPKPDRTKPYQVGQDVRRASSSRTSPTAR